MKKFVLTKLNNRAIFYNENTLFIYTGKRGIAIMKNLSKKLSALVLTTMFATMQIASADGLANATIGSTAGGYAGMTTGTNSATLNFTGNAHVNWNQLNVGSNETLNFNAINGAHGLTVLNTVSGGQMSHIYGTVNSNEGISHLIISNPSGLMFDGAHFTTAGDLTLTTQKLSPIMNGNVMTGYTGVNEAATEGVAINGAVFNVGGRFNITAPDIQAAASALNAGNGVKLVTRDGENYLVSTNNGTPNQGIRLESVSVDGDVYIVAGKDYTKIVNGGTVNGNMTVDSEGIVTLNYTNPEGNDFNVHGDLTVNSNGALNLGESASFVGHGNMMYLRNANIDGDLNMANSGGFLEVKDIKVDGNANLATTLGANSHVKHFIHVIGDSEVGGNMNINSAHNIHIGNYNIQQQQLLPGHLKVGGDLTAHAENGHVMVTIDTEANKIALKSDTLNVLTDDKTVLKANEYQFESNGYIGGIGTYVNSQGQTVDGTKRIISLMENYTYIPSDILAHTYMNIAGGDVTKIATTPNAAVYIKSNGDMTVNNANAGHIHLTAVDPNDPLGGDIELKDNVTASQVTIGGETKLLTLPLESRNYTLNYTRINGTEPTVIDGATEITYGMLEDTPNGYNVGTQTAANTRIKAPNAPLPPGPPTPPPPGPQPDPDPDPTPDIPDNDNIKFLNNMNRDQVSTAIDAGQVYTPIAFAADLDDEIDTGVRKNVDGSVTVVRPYTPSK